MMRRDLRQGRNEFQARVKRVSRAHNGYGAKGRPAFGQHPFLAAILGFVWFYAIIRVADNRTLIEDSLARGDLGAMGSLTVLGAVATVIVLSLVAAVVLGVRVFMRHPMRKTVVGIMTGIAAATTYCYMPSEVYGFVYDMLDPQTQAMIASAGDRVDTLNVGSVQMVSSWLPGAELQ